MSQFPNFDLADLRAFVAVADLGRFGAAAQALHISQPALSRRIEKLESALGVRLFDRTTRRVQLTAIGRSFARKASHVLDELEGTLLGITEVASTRQGEITIACLISIAPYALPQILRTYAERFPGVRVRIIDEDANNVLAAVASGEAEFGIDVLETREPSIDFHPLRRERFIAVLQHTHPLATRKSIKWSELSAERLMTIDKTNVSRLLLDNALATTARRPYWMFEARLSSTLLGLAEAGLGIALVPELSFAQVHPGLLAVPIVGPSIRRHVGLITRRGHRLAPNAQHLFQMIDEYFRAANTDQAARETRNGPHPRKRASKGA